MATHRYHAAQLSAAAVTRLSGDSRDVAVVEVDSLMEAPPQCGGIAGNYVLAGDLSLFDLRDATLGDAHALGNLLLGQTASPAHLRKAVPDNGCEQFLLSCLDGLFSAG